jgi:hypothetical protein
LPAKNRPIPEIVQDLWELVRDYARQETVDPLRNLGRYLAAGTGGALLISIGLFFLGLSSLRVLQTQTGGRFDDGWMSSLPYLIVLVALTIVVVIALSRISKRTAGSGR